MTGGAEAWLARPPSARTQPAAAPAVSGLAARMPGGTRSLKRYRIMPPHRTGRAPADRYRPGTAPQFPPVVPANGGPSNRVTSRAGRVLAGCLVRLGRAQLADPGAQGRDLLVPRGELA